MDKKKQCKMPRNFVQNGVAPIVFGFLFVLGINLANALYNPTDTPDAAPGDMPTVIPSVHSLDIGGGALSGDGVSITNTGAVHFKNDLPEDYINPNYGVIAATTKGGMDVSALYSAFIGTNKVKGSHSSLCKSGPCPAPTYGRFGIKTNLYGYDMSLKPINVQAFLGYVDPLDPGYILNPSNENMPVETGNVYSFYTPNGATFVGGDFTIDSPDGIDITNPSGAVTVLGDVSITGDYEVGGSLETPYIEYTNTTKLRGRFGTIKDSKSSSGYTANRRFNEDAECPAGSYRVGCSGYIGGAYNYAPYRGAVPKSSNPQACTAYARKHGSPQPDFTLNVVAYCYYPGDYDSRPTWDQT